MALSFNKSKGAAQKSNITTFAYQDGDNSVRLVGDILARYVYWVTGENDKNIPLECLSFDRNEERFNNKEKDWVREYYPDLKCGWSYVMQCIHNGEVKVINLKKKLWEQILTAAEDLGDPTDPETGWDVKFKRVKTGPLAYNVEYQLQVLKCKPRALKKSCWIVFDSPQQMKLMMKHLMRSLLFHDSLYGRLALKARSKECATRVGTKPLQNVFRANP